MQPLFRKRKIHEVTEELSQSLQHEIYKFCWMKDTLTELRVTTGVGSRLAHPRDLFSICHNGSRNVGKLHSMGDNETSKFVTLSLIKSEPPLHSKAQRLLYVPPSLTFTNSTFCPHSVFMCFVWISEQTAIISLYSINWLVFITETECVYCAVRSGSSQSTLIFVFKGAVPWLERLVSGLSPWMDRVRPQISPCGICFGRSGTDTVFSPVLQFPLSVSFHQCSILIHSSTTDAV
jgi:hypothetical protein